MPTKYEVKKKRPKALWHTAFPDQVKKLHPEWSAAGGVKARSQSESVRMEIYNAIKALFLKANPFCQTHADIFNETGSMYRINATEIHHRRGRDGNLLFDVRHWSGCCEKCHRWIHENTAEAQALGLLAKEDWRKQDE